MIEHITSNFRRVKALAPMWDMTVSDQIYYLVVVEGGEDLGAMVFVPDIDDGLQIHVQLGHGCRGKQAAAAIEEGFQWIFDETEHDTIGAAVPPELRWVHVMARRVGMNFDEIDCVGLRCYSIGKYAEQRVS